MTNTRQKLLEAKYFLERMIESQSERDAFKYNLSAFLTAFRSVTLLMQKEFKNHLGFADWYEIQQGRLKADDKMKLLNTKRTMTIHQQPVQPHARVSVSITEHISLSESVSVVLTHKDGTVERYDTPPPEPPPAPAEGKTTIQWRWYFEEVPDIDVVTVCEECMAKLETVVSECEQTLRAV